jgi:hypothetical protein
MIGSIRSTGHAVDMGQAHRMRMAREEQKEDRHAKRKGRNT